MTKGNALKGVLCAIGCETLYGLSYCFTKQATTDASALALLGWRFLIAFLVMSLLIRAGLLRVELKGKNLKPLLLVALFSPVIYFIGETVGIGNTTASESGVILACIPIASLIASAAVLGKRPRRLQVIGILITLAGVATTVFSAGMSSSFSITGYTFLLAAVVSYALYCVFVEKASEFSGIEITYMMLAAGAMVFVSLALIEAIMNDGMRFLVTLPLSNNAFLTAILYQGIGCSVCAFFLSNVAIASLGVNRAASFVGVSTVVSIVAGMLLLHEALTAMQIVGAAIIVAGVITANFQAKQS